MWICKRIKISVSSYYNHLLNKNARYKTEKERILKLIKDIYYMSNQNVGHRPMVALLAKKGVILSKTTVFKYMNTELKLYAILKTKKSRYKKHKPDVLQLNKLNQKFSTHKKNEVWCTDFTYIKLKNGQMVYNQTILDIYDRSVIVSRNSKYITSEFALDTLKIALKKEKIKRKLLLHSDRGSQFTSFDFNNFCKENGIIHSMSRASQPYDNAVIERFYKTFKSEFVYKNNFYSIDDLDNKTDKYIHLWYNFLRPHSFNNYLSPLEKRFT